MGRHLFAAELNTPASRCRRECNGASNSLATFSYSMQLKSLAYATLSRSGRDLITISRGICRIGLDTLQLTRSDLYEEQVIAIANSRRPGVKTYDGLLGATAGVLEPEMFDACISASVLEHVADGEIERVAIDMFRILRCGGWALHSIDLPTADLQSKGVRWLAALRSAGFVLDDCGVDQRFGGGLQEDKSDPVFLEPLSIRALFFGGYKKSIWGLKSKVTGTVEMATILVAAKKNTQ